MNNQSPYMQAYQAGIKLAAHEFFGKFANEEERDRLLELYNNPELPEYEREYYASELKALDSEAREENAAPSAPAPKSQSFGRPSMTRDPNRSLGLLGANPLSIKNFELPTTPPAQTQQQAPAPAQSFTEEERSAINAANSRLGMGVDPIMAEPNELARTPKFPSIRGAKALNQAAAQRAQDRRDEAEIDALLEDDEARGNVEDDQMFGAVRGGYAKQLKALRGMEGLSQGARDLLGQTDYRQLASAMGNRGLRVGDQFSVQDLLGRLRGQQARSSQEASSGEAIGTTAAPIQIQNRRGRTVNRGALRPRPQRPAAPRTPAPKPNVRSMVNQLGIKPNQPLNLGPAPSEADLLRSVGGAKSPAAVNTNQDLMGNMQGFPNIGF